MTQNLSKSTIMNPKNRTHTCELSIKLRQLRIYNGQPQSAIAVDWGVSQAAVSKLEAGKSIIGVDLLERIADLYKLSLDELVHDNIKTLRLKTIERL